MKVLRAVVTMVAGVVVDDERERWHRHQDHRNKQRQKTKTKSSIDIVDVGRNHYGSWATHHRRCYGAAVR